MILAKAYKKVVNMIDYEIIIPSKGRANKVGGYTLKLFPSATLFVDEIEKDEYEKHCPNTKIRTHSHDLAGSGMGEIRRAMILSSEAEVVVMLDDDLHSVWYIGVTGKRRKIQNIDELLAIIENTIQMAFDLNLSMFSWVVQGRGSLYYEKFEPFRLDKYSHSHWGVIGKEILPDPKCKTIEDYDMFLKNLLRKRIVFQDTRYQFDPATVCGKGRGGCQSLRTKELEIEMTKYMESKWGKYFKRKITKNRNEQKRELIIKVKRKNDRKSI